MDNTNSRNEIEISNNGSITIGFSWDRFNKQYSGGLISGYLAARDTAVDCDASAYILRDVAGKRSVADNVTYDHPEALGGLIKHGGDNQTGGSLKDDEKIILDLGKISDDVESIVFTLDLFKEKKRLKLGKLNHIKVRIYETESETELGTFSITGVGDKVIRVGTLGRNDKRWVYRSKAEGLDSVGSKNEIAEALVE